MAYSYRQDFSGGVNGRVATALEPVEMEDSLNVYARGGVLEPALGWVLLDAAVPSGKRVLAGVPRPDRTSVVVLHGAGAGYEYAILAADGSALSAARALPGWGGAAAARVSGVWTPSGTVVVCAAPGLWPVVVLDDNSAVTLESLDVRLRRPGVDYQVGVTALANLFRKDLVSPDVEDLGSGDQVTLAAGQRFVTVASTVTFQAVRLTFDDVAGVAGKLWFLDEDARTGATPFDDADVVAVGSVSGAELVFEADWDPAMARTSSEGFGGVADAVVGRGQIRAVIRLAGAYEGKELQAVAVEHRQYLRLVLYGQTPHLVELHRNRVCLAFGDSLQFGPYNRLSGWELRQEYFSYGGDRVVALKSHTGFLAVLMDHAIHAITGNSDENWGVTKLADSVGTAAPESVESDIEWLVFSDRVGRLSMLRGADVRQVTRHCARWVDAARGSGTLATHLIEEELLLVLAHGGAVKVTGDALPAALEEGDGLAFVVAPESLRSDVGGGWKVSVFPFIAPGVVAMSWTTVDRRPVVVVGSRLYRLEGMVPARRYVRLPTRSGDPSGQRVSRVTVTVTVGTPPEGLTLSYVRAGGVVLRTVVVGAEEVAQRRGIVRRSVPATLGLVSVIVDSGNQTLLSITVEYYGRHPGG